VARHGLRLAQLVEASRARRGYGPDGGRGAARPRRAAAFVARRERHRETELGPSPTERSGAAPPLPRRTFVASRGYFFLASDRTHSTYTRRGPRAIVRDDSLQGCSSCPGSSGGGGLSNVEQATRGTQKDRRRPPLSLPTAQGTAGGRDAPGDGGGPPALRWRLVRHAARVWGVALRLQVTAYAVRLRSSVRAAMRTTASQVTASGLQPTGDQRAEAIDITAWAVSCGRLG
jgi:hypothetical protein